MKAQSTIEKKERELRKEIKSINSRWLEADDWEKQRCRFLENYWRALRWVLGKDDDEMCLTQGVENKSTTSQGGEHGKCDLP